MKADRVMLTTEEAKLLDRALDRLEVGVSVFNRAARVPHIRRTPKGATTVLPYHNVDSPLHGPSNSLYAYP